jgi:HTH-type transcriptional regulator/antitoxin HigA
MTIDDRRRWTPDWTVAPGEVLAEALSDRGMSQAELSRRIARPLKTINEIVNGRASITAETAIQLERALGINASLWTGLEDRYREGLARAKSDRELGQYATWADSFPVSDMVRHGLIAEPASAESKVATLLEYFGVGSPEGWEKHWGQVTTRFRLAARYPSTKPALASWLRWGELEASRIVVGTYDESRFISVVTDARVLTRKAVVGLAIDRLQRECASVGVALVVVPELEGARVSGATRWRRPNQAILQLSLRFRWNDQFWYSFFHEAGHLITGNRRVESAEDFADADATTDDPAEIAADTFARDILIPPEAYADFLKAGRPTTQTVKVFAELLTIDPALVVGRLQRDGHVPHSAMNHLKREYQI